MNLDDINWDFNEAGNWPFGAAASMILLTLVLIVLMIYARQQSRTESKYS